MRTIASWLPWSSLNTISNSIAARCTILIPLIGYLIIFNESVARYLNLVAELGGSGLDPRFSVSPRLLLIYFGLCFIAVGVILYSAFCPKGVRYYGSANAFVGNVQDSIKRWAVRELEVSTATYEPEEFEAIRDSYKHSWPESGPTDQQREDYRNGLLHIEYRRLNQSYAPVRLAIWTVYVIGFVCLGIPSLGVFARVCRILYRVLAEQASLFF